MELLKYVDQLEQLIKNPSLYISAIFISIIYFQAKKYKSDIEWYRGQLTKNETKEKEKDDSFVKTIATLQTTINELSNKIDIIDTKIDLK